MTRPIINQVGSKLELYWEDCQIHVLVTRIREHKDGRVTAELSFKTDALPRPHILYSQLNLLSSRSRRDLAKELDDIYPNTDWDTILEQLCVLTMQSYRQGTLVKEISSEDEPEEPSFLVEPLVYENQPNLIFGEGGTGKSYLALVLAILTQLPYEDNPLNLIPKKANVLYLDYETNEDEIRRRLRLLSKGFSIPMVSVKYRQCIFPFVEDIENLEEIVLQEKVNFVIVDSIGVAAGQGNLNEAQTATAFYSALRRLSTTSLLISHLAKDTESQRPSPFGSVYWRNICRNEWMIRRQQELGENILNIALFHQKNNLGGLRQPIGFQFVFENDKVSIQSQDIKTVPEFLDYLTLKARIIELLKNEGKMPAGKIAEVLGASQISVRSALNRNKSLFVKIGNEWGLKAND